MAHLWVCPDRDLAVAVCANSLASGGAFTDRSSNGGGPSCSRSTHRDCSSRPAGQPARGPGDGQARYERAGAVIDVAVSCGRLTLTKTATGRLATRGLPPLHLELHPVTPATWTADTTGPDRGQVVNFLAGDPDMIIESGRAARRVPPTSLLTAAIGAESSTWA